MRSAPRRIANLERDFMSEVQEIQRRRLGRGLSALLGGGAPSPEEIHRNDASELREVPLAAIDRNPFQPRKSFDPEGIEELAGSIREHGVLQPLLVRELDSRFQLVAGERRLLAAHKAGLSHVPCRVVDVIDKTACEFALEENLKRRDLNDIEKAYAFRDYLRHFQCTIEELAKQLSMNRSTVSNLLRLLDLPEAIQNAVISGRISTGHARALLSLELADQLALCGRIQAESLSVRQTEAAVKQMLGRETTADAATAHDAASTQQTVDAGPGEQAVPADNNPEVSATAVDGTQWENAANDATVLFEVPERTNHIRSMEEQLQRLLGTPVEIRLSGKESGAIVIPFHSNEEFERVLRELRRRDAA